MKNLLNALRHRHTLVFIDFEGTQFSHEIIAAGLVKVVVDDNLNIISEDDGLLIYTKSRLAVGKIVTQMTNITDKFLKENGVSWKNTIEQIDEYVGEDLSDTIFICFGNNDPKMIVESNRYSRPDNLEISQRWLPNFFDFMVFIAQYIKDNNNNNYSLTNLLKLFNIQPVGESHNPLNDAKDLKNLLFAFKDNPEIVFNEYKKVLSHQRHLPTPIKILVDSLYKNGSVSMDEFEQYIKNFLE